MNMALALPLQPSDLSKLHAHFRTYIISGHLHRAKWTRWFIQSGQIPYRLAGQSPVCRRGLRLRQGGPPLHGQ